MKRVKLLIFLISLGTAVAVELNYLWEQTLRNNPSLKGAKTKVERARYELKKTYSLYLPKITLLYTKNRLTKEPSLLLPLPSSPLLLTLSKETDTYALRAEQLLYDFGRRETLVRVHELKKEIEENLYTEAVLDKLLEVALAYLDALSARELIKVYEKQVKALSLHEKLARAYYEKGLVAITDVLEAKVKLAQAELNLKTAKRDYELALENLSRLTQIPKSKLRDLKPPQTNPKLKQLSHYEKLALRRPLLKALTKKVEVQEKLRRLALSEYLPQLLASVSYLRLKDAPLLDETTLITLSASVSFSPIAPYYTALAREKSKEEATHTLRDAELALLLEVKKAHESVKTALSKLEVAKRALELAKKHYELSLEQYKHQLITSTQLALAEASLTRARRSLTLARYELLRHYFILLRASGTLGRER